MFAVEGWKLGQLVSETTQKNKRKRKREEGDEHKSTENLKSHKGPRKNPFSLKEQHDSHTATGPSFEVKPSKTPPTGVTGTDKPRDKHTKSSHQPQDSQDQKRQKAQKKTEKKRRQEQQSGPEIQSVDNVKSSIQPLQQADSLGKLTPLQKKMKEKLTGSQFRHINERLYTTHSSEALTLFTEEPSLFHHVHTCFCGTDTG
jgi:hypothetical protein